MERPIRIECREAIAHNERGLVALIGLRAVCVDGWTLQQSPFYNQQLADLKAHIEIATRWSITCDNHSYPRQFVNRLKPQDADTLVWRIDVPTAKAALGVTPASVAIAWADDPLPEEIDLTGD